ncbi:MAG: hypothetical protein WKF58_14215 [Ilumatobacteraceae bacterium]
MALAPELGRHGERGGHGAREVDVDGLDGGGRVAVELFLVAQHTERDDHDVEVAVALDQ